ncbi:hypothetical protein H4Q26_005825 [Puccinia striiformis f. sp. tritici PST-130]|nr:hypothetical protein H4Q26_005825 [Puccinia striiformis f. sp. tritici PST-130]
MTSHHAIYHAPATWPPVQIINKPSTSTGVPYRAFLDTVRHLATVTIGRMAHDTWLDDSSLRPPPQSDSSEDLKPHRDRYCLPQPLNAADQRQPMFNRSYKLDTKIQDTTWEGSLRLLGFPKESSTWLSEPNRCFKNCIFIHPTVTERLGFQSVILVLA